MEKTEKLEKFKNKIIEIYGDEVGKNVLKEIETEPLVSFRINTLKGNTKDVSNQLADLGFKISDGELPNSYYVKEFPAGSLLSRTKPFEEGKLYIQNISSMIPSLVLDPKPGENILDLCAAPGSKTTHIAALSGNKARVTAVENNFIRFNLLKNNCQNQGTENILFIKASSQNLLNLYPHLSNYFDKVLCDIPCSNEGLIRKPNSHSFKYWNPKLAKKISILQKKLIASGITMLKPGGTLIYSTCTYSVEENEQVISWALKTFPEMNVSEVKLENIPTKSGITSWKEKTFDPRLEKTLRLLPNRHFEAFFIAKLEKAS